MRSQDFDYWIDQFQRMEELQLRMLMRKQRANYQAAFACCAILLVLSFIGSGPLPLIAGGVAFIGAIATGIFAFTPVGVDEEWAHLHQAQITDAVARYYKDRGYRIARGW